MTNGKHFTSQLPTALGSGDLKTADVQNVTINATGSGSPWWSVLLSFAPLLLLIAFFVWTGRRALKGMGGMGGLGGISGFGRSRTKVVDTERPTTRFADVAGYDGRQAGDRGGRRLPAATPIATRRPARSGPRGVLMVGPPGTGKTLLARAVAGEAGVPFLSVTGSGFVEMFVGVGASRVRDLFADARKRAPAIIFIDEIDAIGRDAAAAAIGGNDEREQTLNQLLAEMDGFDPATGVVVIAATNRPEILDPALLRPGRFDRQVVVPLPNPDRAAPRSWPSTPRASSSPRRRPRRRRPGDARASPAPTSPTSSTRRPSTPSGPTGGDHHGRTSTRPGTGSCWAAARRPTRCCPRRSTRSRCTRPATPWSRRCPPHADPVAKVTILPAGHGARASPSSCPTSNATSTARATSTTAGRTPGRAGRRTGWSSARRSTGAADDLAGATELATRMVREFGLSEVIGPVGYGDGIARLPAGGRAAATGRTRRRPSGASTPRSRACCGRPRRRRWNCCGNTGRRWTG